METIRDYLLLILFTGLRREEALALTWKYIDFAAGTLTIPDPKNHVDHYYRCLIFYLTCCSAVKKQATPNGSSRVAVKLVILSNHVNRF